MNAAGLKVPVWRLKSGAIRLTLHGDTESGVVERCAEIDFPAGIDGRQKQVARMSGEVITVPAAFIKGWPASSTD